MPRHFVSAALALSLLAFPMSASAQAGDPDVRCLIVSNIFAQKEADPQRKQFATLAVSFYLGRIDARLTQAQFRAAVIAMGKQTMGKEVGPIMSACAQTLQTKQIAVSQMIKGIAQAQPRSK